VQRHQLADGAFLRRHPTRMVPAQTRERVCIPGPDRPQELTGLLFLLFKIQDILLRAPGPQFRRKRVSVKRGASIQQVGAALSADETRPARD
jgi:hypothetical protein